MHQNHFHGFVEIHSVFLSAVKRKRQVRWTSFKRSKPVQAFGRPWRSRFFCHVLQRGICRGIGVRAGVAPFRNLGTRFVTSLLLRPTPAAWCRTSANVGRTLEENSASCRNVSAQKKGGMERRTLASLLAVCWRGQGREGMLIREKRRPRRAFIDGLLLQANLKRRTFGGRTQTLNVLQEITTLVEFLHFC